MSTLFRGARILVPAGDLLQGHALLVSGDRIARVAPESEFSGWSGPEETLNGATILPGLVDAHVHLVYGGEANPAAVIEAMRPAEIAMKCLQNAQATLAGGVTAIRDCGGRDYIEFAVRDACNRGQFPGPTIRAAGRMICMTGGHGNRHGRVADGVDEVVKAVREQIHAGSDLIKIMATGGVMTPGVNPEDAHYSEAELAAGIAEGHRFHLHAASHAQGAQGILNAVRAGVDSIEHGIFMTEECVEAMLARGTVLVPTIAAVRNILLNADRGIPEYIVEKSRRVAERHRASILMFYKAGGTIAMGTDAGTPFNRHGENALELAFMVEVGMSPPDAILAATVNGARLLGLPDCGRIEEGAVADLLFVQGDPLSDIARVAERTHHRLVVKGGRIAHRPRPAETAPPAALAAD